VRFECFSFGSLQIDGVTYDYDLVIDRGEIRKRKKKASNLYRAAYGASPEARPPFDLLWPASVVATTRPGAVAGPIRKVS
jgi:hypothetical protein